MIWGIFWHHTAKTHKWVPTKTRVETDRVGSKGRVVNVKINKIENYRMIFKNKLKKTLSFFFAENNINNDF